MSTPTTIQSNLVPIAVSTDSGSTYKNIVCKKSWGFNGSTATNVEETDCGPLVGLGSNNFTFDFEAVMNTTPDSDQVSAKGLLDIWNNQTQVMLKVLYPSPGGTNIFISGVAYLTSYTLVNQVGNLMTVTGTFTGNGTVDTTP